MPRKKILIIDDDIHVIEKLRIPLVLKEYEVVSARDGLQGLEMVRSIKPDLVVLDLLIPKLEGLKVARLFKFDERYKHIPVISVTHLSKSKVESDTQSVGIDEVFSKPIDVDKVAAAIEQYIKKAAQ